MNTHLSKKAMLRWQAGEASELERGHVAECTQCQAQIQPLTDALSWFGAAAREWGAERAAVPRRLQAVAGGVHRWYRFAIAAALACVLLLATGVALLDWSRSHMAPMQAQAPQQQQVTQQELARDNALLDEVDQDVSQEVPAAMQPLSWSASDTTARQ
jgi:hypothetical protein